MTFRSWDNYNLNIDTFSNLDHNEKFTHELSIQPNVINQKDTGYCWIYSGLNVITIKLIQKYNLPLNFELSAHYLMFWDKYEKCYNVLHKLHEFKTNIDEPCFISNYLNKPINDMGQWYILANLIRKYGIMPKSAFPTSYATEYTHDLNKILNHKIKEYYYYNTNIDQAMKEIYNILVNYLGTPPKNFLWNTTTTLFNDVTPHLFYTYFVSNCFDVNDYISIINDPRNPYFQNYTIEHTNMRNMHENIHYNVPMKHLIECTKKSILNNNAVWFTCDIYKYSSCQYGLCGETFFNDPFQKSLTKKQQLELYDSYPNHAMTIHGFTKSKYWKIQNTWGQIGIYKGYLKCDNIWFNRYVYQVIVPKHYVKKPKTIKTKQLPYWDPFGVPRSSTHNPLCTFKCLF